MTTPAATSSGSYFQPTDWAQMIQGLGQGAAMGLGSTSQSASTRREAKESKRRTLGKLLNNLRNRELNMVKAGQDYAGDIQEFKANQIQDMARGFADSLKGSSIMRGR